MSTARARAKRHQVITEVMRYFATHIGEDVNVHELVHELGYEASQIKAAIYNIRSKNPDTVAIELRVIVTGSIWRYVPRPVDATPANATPIDATPTPVQPASTPSKPTLAPANASTQTTNGASLTIIYQRVGELNGVTIICDEDGRCYEIKPINLSLDQ